MNTKEIAGGVSPLKAKWKGTASRGSGGQKRSISGKMGGAAGIRNTQTKKGKKRRGGFSKTGAKGSNVHGYGILTRFKPITSKAGPLAPATSAKTGPPTTGGGGGGGGDTNTYNYGDDNSDNRTYEDNRQDNSTVEIDNKETIENNPEITNETNTEVKTDVDQTNKNKTRQLQSYEDFWTQRINSGKHSTGMKTYIKKHGGDLEKARKEWEIVSRKYASQRNANRTNQSNESDVKVNTNTDNSTKIEGNKNSTSGVVFTKGKSVLNEKSAANPQYDPAKRSPNKMKSHAWDMLQKQKKARGGTQKY